MNGFSNKLLEGKTILITGAGKGIGRACALAASAAGADVIAVARTTQDLERLASDCENPITIWTEDVNQDRFYQRIKSLSRLDGLLNNAGMNKVAPMLNQSDDNIDAVINLNIRAAYKVAQAAITPMLNADAPSIVHMSSQMGHVGSPGRTLYCMSKHAIEGLSKAMAVELAPHNIRVNTVAPTFIDTPMTRPMFEDASFKAFVMNHIPLKRLGTLEDVASSCLFLLSHLSHSTTGSCIKVDGGWTAH